MDSFIFGMKDNRIIYRKLETESEQLVFSCKEGRVVSKN